MGTSPIIVALDFSDASSAMEFVDKVDPDLCRLKVGFELFVAEGPAFVQRLVGKGFDVFLDLKFHDIPNTVAGACRVAAGLGVWMVNVHASGGPNMLLAARDAIDGVSVARRPLLIAVTVLTSMDGRDLAALGVEESPQEHVLRLAKMSRDSGLDGIVCSAAEAPMLRSKLPTEFALVTPGIRPEGAALGDQKRVVTPHDAIRLGVDYLVIGRPITQAVNPLVSLSNILDSLA